MNNKYGQLQKGMNSQLFHWDMKQPVCIGSGSREADSWLEMRTLTQKAKGTDILSNHKMHDAKYLVEIHGVCFGRSCFAGRLELVIRWRSVVASVSDHKNRPKQRKKELKEQRKSEEDDKYRLLRASSACSAMNDKSLHATICCRKERPQEHVG